MTTSTAVKQLHMVRLRLPADRLFALGKARHLPVAEADLGYLAHCLLGELFGDEAPKPFHIESGAGREVTILGYSARAADILLARAAASDRLGLPSLTPSSIASKPLPETFPVGQVLSFKVRICPVVLMSAGGPKNRKGAEVDAFLRRCRQVADPAVPVDREDVYRQWLQDEVERHGGGHILVSRMSAFKLEKMTRRTQGEKRMARGTLRPDATFEGLLEVTDGERFLSLLSRGLGRHRAFGFGMLLLKRPEA
ncbi:MAG: type I-E CRISPR-associated protein Cas6/Cse3/CasE [Dehalococcoidales bacterium]|nr:type I-E CRISPR-associated protein Cas6/Cse3/CasE [Dehalococcoidales bacterium]